MNYETLRFVREGAIARVTLSRPARRNAVDARLVRELGAVCAEISDDATIRVAVLCAEGGVFCTEWDAEVFTEAGSGLFREASDPFGVLARMATPVVAAIDGDCFSAGLEMALAADVRVCSARARFALPETEFSLIPLAGGSQRLPRLVGRGRALSMLLTGEVLDAEAAYRAGLVSRVVAPELLDAEVMALAGRIAARGPIAERYAKEAVHRGLDMTLDQALRYETDLTIILQTTEDRAEGVRSFLEGRRTPKFKGK